MFGIGEILLKRSVISSDQLVLAMTHQKAHGGGLPASLVNLGFVGDEDLVSHLVNEYRFPVVDPLAVEPDPEALKLIPHALAHKHGLLPLRKDGSMLTVAIADPSNLAAMNEVRFLTGCAVKVVLAQHRPLEKAIARFYHETSLAYDEALTDLNANHASDAAAAATETATLERSTESAPIVRLVNTLMIDAIQKRASDIHIEPYEMDLRVRFRIDGVLHDIMQPPVAFKGPLASRVKIMARLDISQRRLPQDGAMKIRTARGKEVSFRVSCMPTVHGEKIVLRLLDKSNLSVDLGHLGFDAGQLTLFRHAIQKPHGMVLVTGPTGSGKSTTLYSALAEINQTERNISTVEDPVEYQIRGVNQVQVNEEIGYGFPAALRSFLRQDPDVLMVGEIRDAETAEIAVKAALTGHLVLSTLHTNDAPSTVNRLLNMGVEPFLVSSSLHLIIAQRLVRVICTHCKAAVADTTPEGLLDVGFRAAEVGSLKIRHGKGCDECAKTGYRGRLAIYEILPVTEAIREQIVLRSSSTAVKQIALAEGMQTLRASGLAAVRAGLTTIQEVLRVTAAD